MSKNYESEITQFIKQYKKDHPDTGKAQREGRAILWEKEVDTEAQDGFKNARVSQRPYVYSNE